MQFKLAALTTLAVATLAAATPTKRADQCNVGTLQCCNSLQAANSPAASNLLGPLGVVVGAVQGLVGITCSPLSAIAISGNSCTTQSACCTNNSFNGAVALGCTPINIGV
ncbi:hypothetical protein D9619_007793 [Psilocybe cf. subviscida]|uniref:Hydrophobin n=1 Tax=Psilocybe cf. subviscida TaxID=2480587 RepID=A0A8H5ESU2_9AGAR|nr:hypothetical protein D9619_007793 [Psilocybe cf. subviscida]